MAAIFYDTETTGISASKDYIIEIAAYDPVSDRTFEALINPGVPIPAEATNIHGISDAMVADKPSFGEVGRQFIEFCGEDAILIAHNNDAFDVHFLRSEFGRHDIAMPEWRFIDTLKWARRYRPDLPRHALQFLREVYGFEANNAHRALDDVIMMHQIFHCMIDDLSYEQVYALLNQERTLKHMPFGKYQGKPLKEVPDDYVAWMHKNGAFDRKENDELKSAFEKLGKLVLA